ncbi:MAG: hypothetical protein WC604_00075 [Candidatus Gracilibacteria bacterium]
MPDFEQNSDLEQHEADIESIKKLDKKLGDQLDKIYKRLVSKIEADPGDIDANSEFLKIKMLRTRLSDVGKKLGESLPKKEKAAVLQDVANIATELRGSLYKFDIAEDTISSFGEEKDKSIDDRIREALEKNPEEIQKEKLKEVENLLISAVDIQTMLKERYFTVSGPEICRRYYLDIMNRALDRNISYVLAVLSGNKDVLHFEEILEKTDTLSLNSKELRGLERGLGVDPQSLDGAMKLLQMRVNEADDLLRNVDNIATFNNSANGLADVVDYAMLTGVVDSEKVDELWNEADAAFKESNALLLTPASGVFKDELAVFDRFSLHGLDQRSDIRALKELALGLKAVKTPEFELYLSVVREIDEEKSDKELIASYKKLNAKISGTSDSLIEKYGPIIGWKFFEILESIKQELINREVMRQIESGEFKLDGLLDLAKTRSGFVKVYEATDDFGYVRRTREGFDESGDVSSSSEVEDINAILEKSDAYLILVKEGKGLRVYFTQKFYVDNGKLQTEEGKKSLSETPDALAALQEISSEVASFNTSKKIIVEKYLMENVETNSLIKDFYRGNLSLAAGDMKKAKEAYLSFLNGYKKTQDVGVSENQLLEAKTNLKNIAKLELIQIFKGIDEIITSIDYDIYHKKQLGGMWPKEGREIVRYLTTQKEALSLASDLLKSDDDVVTVEQALTVPLTPGKLKDFDLLSDLRWANDSLYQRKLGQKLGQKDLYHAAQYFYEQSFGGLIGKFANLEYEGGKFVFEKYYAEHSGNTDTKKKALDRATEARDHELERIEGDISLLNEEMGKVMRNGSRSGELSHLKDELIKLDARKAELESADYLAKLEEQILKGLIVEEYRQALFGEVTEWAKKNREKDANAYTWLNEFEGHYADTDSSWYEFWGGTDKERAEFLSGLVFDIPMVVVSGGIAGLVGKKVAMIAARKLAVEELTKLTLRQVARKAGMSALARTMAARGTGFLVECETFNTITLAGSSISAGRLDQFTNPMQHLKGLGHTLVTLGTLKVTGAALHRVPGMRSFAGQYALTPVVDTAALTTTQYVLEGGDIDVRKAIRSNLVLSFGIRAGHGLAGLNSSPVSKSGRATREARKQVIESDLKGTLPEATLEGGVFTRWSGKRKASTQADYVADYVLDSGVVDARGNPTSKGVFEGMTLSEAHGLAKFARERGLDVEFLAERCKTGQERLELQRRVVELERSGLKEANAGEQYLEMYRATGLNRAVFEAFVASPNAKMSAVYEVHKFLSNNPEAGGRLVEGMSNVDGYDFIEFVLESNLSFEFVEAKCKTAVEKVSLLREYGELESTTSFDRKGRVSMDTESYITTLNGKNGLALSILTSKKGISLVVEKGADKAAVRRVEKISEWFTNEPFAAKECIDGMTPKEALEFLDFSTELGQSASNWVVKGLSAKEKMGVVSRVRELSDKFGTNKNGKLNVTEKDIIEEFKTGKEGRFVAEVLFSRSARKVDFSLENIYEVFEFTDSFEFGSKLLLEHLKQHPKDAEKIIDGLQDIIKELAPKMGDLGPTFADDLNALASKSPKYRLLVALYRALPGLPKKSATTLALLITSAFTMQGCDALDALLGAGKIVWNAIDIAFYGGMIPVGVAVAIDVNYRANMVRDAQNVAEDIMNIVTNTNMPLAAVGDPFVGLRPMALRQVRGHGGTALLLGNGELAVLRRVVDVLQRLSISGMRTNNMRRYRAGISGLAGRFDTELVSNIDVTAIPQPSREFDTVLRARNSINETLENIQRLNAELAGLRGGDQRRVDIVNQIGLLERQLNLVVDGAERTRIGGEIQVLRDELNRLPVRNDDRVRQIGDELTALEAQLLRDLTAYQTAYNGFSTAFGGLMNNFRVATGWGRAWEGIKIPFRPALFSPDGALNIHRLYIYAPFIVASALKLLALYGGSSSGGDDKPSEGDKEAAGAAGKEAGKTKKQEAGQAREKTEGARPNVPVRGNKERLVSKSDYAAPEGYIKQAKVLIEALSVKRDMTDEVAGLEQAIHKIDVLRGRVAPDPAVDVSVDRAADLQQAIGELKALIKYCRALLTQAEAQRYK